MKRYSAAFVILGAFVFVGGGCLGAPPEVTQTLTPVQDPSQVDVGETVPTYSLDTLDAGDYVLNTEESSLKYSAKRVAANPHTGTVTLSEGVFVWGGEKGFQSGEFAIDMTTMTEDKNNERFLTHIASEDFFAVDEFPTATLVVKSVEPAGTVDTHTVTADLAIRGVTEEIVFPVTIEAANGQVSADASFEIDRTRWGVNFDSGSVFKDLGDKAIEDEIKFTVSLLFSMKQ